MHCTCVRVYSPIDVCCTLRTQLDSTTVNAQITLHSAPLLDTPLWIVFALSLSRLLVRSPCSIVGVFRSAPLTAVIILDLRITVLLAYNAAITNERRKERSTVHDQ